MTFPRTTGIHNKSAEHNVATLLTDKMFTNCNSLLLRQHAVKQIPLGPIGL
jgi:hypothetical protein